MRHVYNPPAWMKSRRNRAFGADGNDYTIARSSRAPYTYTWRGTTYPTLAAATAAVALARAENAAVAGNFEAEKYGDEITRLRAKYAEITTPQEALEQAGGKAPFPVVPVVIVGSLAALLTVGGVILYRRRNRRR